VAGERLLYCLRSRKAKSRRENVGDVRNFSHADGKTKPARGCHREIGPIISRVNSLCSRRRRRRELT
jgi:hypothetical protein